MCKRGTSRNKPPLNHACIAHILFVYSKHIKMGENGPHGACFRSGDPQKFGKQTEYVAKTTVYKQKHLT
jgi:hypothetical protein